MVSPAWDGVPSVNSKAGLGPWTWTSLWWSVFRILWAPSLDTEWNGVPGTEWGPWDAMHRESSGWTLKGKSSQAGHSSE